MVVLVCPQFHSAAIQIHIHYVILSWTTSFKNMLWALILPVHQIYTILDILKIYITMCTKLPKINFENKILFQSLISTKM